MIISAPGVRLRNFPASMAFSETLAFSARRLICDTFCFR